MGSFVIFNGQHAYSETTMIAHLAENVLFSFPVQVNDGSINKL